MPALNQLGKAVSIDAGTFNTTDIVDYNFTLDAEVFEHFGGSPYPNTSTGNINCTLQVKTKDKDFAKNFIKTMHVEDVNLTVQGTVKSLTNTGGLIGIGTPTQETYGFTSAYVSEPVSYTNTADGNGAEFSITFKAHINPTDGVEPDITMGTAVTVTP